MSQTLTQTMHPVTEIEEDNSSDFPFNNHQQENKEEEDTVYVAVGKSPSSIQALSWTLTNFTTPSTILYLIHVFPEINLLPNPCNFSFYLFGLLYFFNHSFFPTSTL